jgi:hypothetical protein
MERLLFVDVLVLVPILTLILTSSIAEKGLSDGLFKMVMELFDDFPWREPGSFVDSASPSHIR